MCHDEAWIIAPLAMIGPQQSVADGFARQQFIEHSNWRFPHGYVFRVAKTSTQHDPKELSWHGPRLTVSYYLPMGTASWKRYKT